MRKKIQKQLNIALKLFLRDEKGNLNNRQKQILHEWSPNLSDIDNSKDNDKESIEARERVRQRVFGYIHSDLKPNPIRTIWNNYRKYAAIAVITITIGGIGWLTFNQIESTNQSMFANNRRSWQTEDVGRMIVILPDSSKVQINAGSRLEIDEPLFNKEKREVWLTGEAFFDVEKNPNKPFIVHTGALQTIVKGTSFNIMAYEELEETVVSVRTGKVEVSNHNKTFGILIANKQLRYDKGLNAAQFSDIDWHESAAWIDGKIVLNHVGVKELALRIKQHFGVEVIYKDNALAGKYVSGIFTADNSIEEVLNTISAVHNIHYEINDKKVIITP